MRVSDNLTDATRKNDCTGIVSGVYARGIWNGGNNEVTFRSVGTVRAESAQEMTDPAVRYLYTGPGESYESGEYYSYDEETGKWTKMEQRPETATVVVSPQLFEDREVKYHLQHGRVFYFHNGSTYYTAGQYLEEDDEAHAVVVSGDYEVDYTTGVMWHRSARKTYGSIIFYHEEDVSDVADGSRLQRLAELAKAELQARLTAFESLDVDAVDPRLISARGGRPELGNYYPVEIPHLGISTFKRLSKVETDLLNPNASKLTFGGKTPMLSDYVAKKGERND